MSSQEQKDIKTVYDEICRSHNGIVDFRYKLLAFLPIASGLVVFVLVNNIPPDAHKCPGYPKIGAGLLRAPAECFKKALIAFGKKYSPN